MEIEVDELLRELGVSSDEISTDASTDEVQFTDSDIDSIIEENTSSEENTDTMESQSENEDTPEEPVEEHQEAEETVEETTQEERTDETLIPLNSPTLLVDETTTRFSGAEWFREIQRSRIIVAGVGGIGSNLCFQLARMIPANMTLYDNDNVEMVNMAGQLYSYEDIGKAKVDAMADMISKYTAMRQVNAIKGMFTSETEPGDIMMCGFDNMIARKIFFESWCEHIRDKSDEDKKKCLFLDGRLSMNDLQVLCIRGDDNYNILRYNREFLFSDSEADETVCSRKQTTYLACMIGSVMVNLFTNFIANSIDPIIPYDLPFFTEYDAQNMIFKTEN